MNGSHWGHARGKPNSSIEVNSDCELLNFCKHTYGENEIEITIYDENLAITVKLRQHQQHIGMCGIRHKRTSNPTLWWVLIIYMNAHNNIKTFA